MGWKKYLGISKLIKYKNKIGRPKTVKEYLGYAGLAAWSLTGFKVIIPYLIYGASTGNWNFSKDKKENKLEQTIQTEVENNIKNSNLDYSPKEELDTLFYLDKLKKDSLKD